MAATENNWQRVHRAIRALPDGEGPFRGLLVADKETTAVAVALTDLEGWEGWPYSDAEHVAGAYDVALLDSGFHALLPWCTLPVETLIGRRQAAGDALASGEVATLAISVLRGMAELGEDVGRVRGAWWLTHDGRPVFVVGRGTATQGVAAQLFDLLAQTSVDRRFARLLLQMRDAAAQPRTMVREMDRWEGEILAGAATKPIRTEVIDRRPYGGAEPQIAGHVTENRMSTAEAVRSLRMPQHEPPEPATKELPVSDLRQELARRFAPVLNVWNKLGGGEERTRNRRLVVAAVAAGLVLLLGALWPTGSDANAREIPLTPSTSEVDSVSDEGSVIQDVAIDDPMSAFVSVIAQARQCIINGDEACSGAIASGSTVPASDLVRIADAHDKSTLADDFGDVAVIRLESTESEFVVVLMRTNQNWLVRDVYQLRGA